MSKIAIIGMGALFPQYTTLEQFWTILEEGKSLLTQEVFEGKTIQRGRIEKSGSDSFFHDKFSKPVLEKLDCLGESYKWSSYVIQEALMNSGYMNDINVLKRTGITFGTVQMFEPEHKELLNTLMGKKFEEKINLILDKGKFQYSDDKCKKLDYSGSYVDTHTIKVASELFKMNGPLLTFSAACATPIYALKLASIYLQEGKADMMLAGAQCAVETDEQTCGLFDLLGVMSEAGKSTPLEKNTEGLVQGSGTGVFVLKRLNDAIRDKDEILAVVEGIGWGNDGGDVSLLAPSLQGQIRCYEDAYQGLEPNIDYIECHATGTKAGDQVEVDSIKKFFSKYGRVPLIGALKGTLGHCFTASAVGSIIKVLLAMKHNIVPATYKVEDPVTKNVVTKNIPWPDNNTVKRAAVNAFGFGGINAHLILSENKEYEKENIFRAKEDSKGLAIVGMGLHVGEADTIEKFENHLRSNSTLVCKDRLAMQKRLGMGDELLKNCGLSYVEKGAIISDLVFDFLNFKVNANGSPYYLRRDLLLLDVAKKALDDAGIPVGEYAETAVIINCTQDFSDINYRISTELKKQINESLCQSCPGLNLKQRERVLDILRQDERTVENSEAIKGIIPSLRANRISAHWHFQGPSFILSEEQGAVNHMLEIADYLIRSKTVKCVVIGMVELGAEPENLFIQNKMGNAEKIKNLGIGEGAAVLVLKSEEQAAKDGNKIYASIQQVKESLSENEFKKITYMELLDKNKISSQLIPKKCRNEKVLSHDGIEEMVGYTKSLWGGVTVIKNALQIYEGLKFQLHGKEKTDISSGESDTSLIGQEDEYGKKKMFLMTRANQYHNCHGDKLKTKYYLLSLSFDSMSEAINLVEEIYSLNNIDCATIAKRYSGERKRKTVCILFSDESSLKEELQSFKKVIDKTFDSGFQWETKHGSYYTSNPLGETAKVVFMSPPGGMYDDEIFYQLVSKFPGINALQEESLTKLKDSSHLTEKEETMLHYIHEINITYYGIKILTERLGIYPNQIIGASMGEISNLIALDSLSFDSTERKEFVSCFLEAVRVAFEVKTTEGKELWGTWYVHGNAKEIEKCVKDEENAFVTIIGSSKDVVICCGKNAYRRIMDKVKGFAISLEGVYFVHTPRMEAYYDKILSLIRLGNASIKENLDYDIYNTFSGEKMGYTKEDFAKCIAHILTNKVNFPNIIEKVYKEGGRVFIDLGTKEVCHNWAQEILKERPNLNLVIYSKKYSMEENFLRNYCKLLSNHIKFREEKIQLEFELGYQQKLRFPKKVDLFLPIFQSKEIIENNLERNQHKRIDKQINAELFEFGEQYQYKYLENNFTAYKLYLQMEKDLLESLFCTEGQQIRYIPVREKFCIWNRDEIVQMTNGSMHEVLGEKYAEVDKYKVRSRMPSPPYLFISRITKISARYGKLEPCMAEIEYDIDEDCVYLRGDNTISPMVLVEASQIGIFIGGYIGIDIISKGTLRFRIADSKTTYYNTEELHLGDTFRLVFRVDKYLKNGDTTLVMCSYDCYKEDILLMKTEAIGGYFTSRDLSNSKGILEQSKTKTRIIPMKKFVYTNCKKTVFEQKELNAYFNGNFTACFGDSFEVHLRKPYFIKPEVRMLDKISNIDINGGMYGLGKIIAEKIISKKHWAFKAHFKNDPVMPATLIVSGAEQLLHFFAIYSGLLGSRERYESGLVADQVVTSCMRGQVRPIDSIITYQMDIKEIVSNINLDAIIADVKIFWQNTYIYKVEGLSIAIKKDKNI